MVTKTLYLINDVIGEGENVLIEGANGVMLDFDHGECWYELTTVRLVIFYGSSDDFMGLYFCGIIT